MPLGLLRVLPERHLEQDAERDGGHDCDDPHHGRRNINTEPVEKLRKIFVELHAVSLVLS